jgi:Large ribosomal RNA subunit accumulation protein YceD
MTTALARPLSRPTPVADLPTEGIEMTVDSTPEEREALARDFKVPAVHALTGTFRLSGGLRRVHVSGRVEATVTQVCVVTLEPFDSDIREEVDVEFASGGGTAPAPPQGKDPPDEIVNGTIDLGVLTAEFLALGLDPYPRKPGVDFAFDAGDDRPESPFAALEKLKRGE